MDKIKMPRFKSFWERAEFYTPPFCRLFAADRVQGHAFEISDEEIAKRSGLTVRRVQEIYWSRTWDGIHLGEMKRFLKAANADFGEKQTNDLMVRTFKRGGKFRHCYRSKEAAKYASLFKMFSES